MQGLGDKYRGWILAGLLAFTAGGYVIYDAVFFKSLGDGKNRQADCGVDYVPVCGQDQRTYDNICVASRRNVVVDHRGACQSNGNSLSETERRFLLWILLARESSGYPAAPISHYFTRADDTCANCYWLYYRWAEDNVVRLEIKQGEVVAAVDQDGYDYIKKQPGERVVFTELQSVADKNEPCGAASGQTCAGGLFCKTGGLGSVPDTCQPL